MNHGVNILAVSKDHVLVKYDKRRLTDPVQTYSAEEFFCTNRRVRISLSNNERYAALCSSGSRIAIFDLELNESVTMLEANNSLYDLHWQPGYNSLYSLDSSGGLSHWAEY